MDLLVVTGNSGAGKSTALRALEDLGYFCVDNLPADMLPALAGKLEAAGDRRRVAVGIGVQLPGQARIFARVRSELVAAGHDVNLLFFEAEVPTLIQRYAETRRRHPVGELPEAIERENELLSDLRELATSVIDTTAHASRDLRRLIRERFGVTGVLRLVILSFGFKNGLPREADLVFDVRFLKNPFDHAALRPLTGLDASVAQFVLEQPAAAEVLSKLRDWLEFHVPHAIAEGRSYLTLAIGCTGGQHRSVALSETLHAELDAAGSLAAWPVTMSVRHRDVHRETP
ncbi:MAG: RNase adapter RapZ [Myxococcales bacterium FL481]|nr:MAG: RNase adapter RapZ [Myxococcales bacterium FL481]